MKDKRNVHTHRVCHLPNLASTDMRGQPKGLLEHKCSKRPRQT